MSLRESIQLHKKAYLIGAVCVVLLLAGLYWFKGRTKQPGYITAAIKRGDINSAVQATGTIRRLLRLRHGPIHLCGLQHARKKRPGAGPT